MTGDFPEHPLLTREEWSGLYDLLVQCVKAPESERQSFVSSFMAADEEMSYEEYRVCPALGFGGKIKYCHGDVYLTTYREDETADRLALLNSTNAQINQYIRHFNPGYGEYK